MLVWGVGLPLLFWQRWRKLTQAYLVYSVGFILVSIGSHLLLGECFLTTLSRELYDAGRHPAMRQHMSFIVRLTEAIAGVRPSERWAVLAWEAALLAGSFVTLWHFRAQRLRARRDSTPPDGTAYEHPEWTTQ